MSTESLLFRAMFEPCLASLQFQTNQSTEIFKTESTWSKAHVYGVSIFLDHVRAMYRQCWDHVWPSFTTIPVMQSSQIFKTGSTQSKAYVYGMSSDWDHVRAMLGLVNCSIRVLFGPLFPLGISLERQVFLFFSHTQIGVPIPKPFSPPFRAICQVKSLNLTNPS